MTARAASRDHMRGTASSERFSDWYSRNRTRSQRLFDLVADTAYYSRPIDLRHPIVFYEGHLPAFSFNTLVKRALGGPSIDAGLEMLFARGIDPSEDQAARSSGHQWPSRATVQQFAAEADRHVRAALERDDLDRPGDPLLNRAEAAFTILEHEAMHQETLLYMWHRLPLDQKRRPQDYQPVVDGVVPAQEWIEVPAGRVTLGLDDDALRFGWDNERPHLAADVAAFTLQRHNVTNTDYLEFVNQGGPAPLFWERHGDAWYWRGMFDLIPLPLSWPVYVSHADASAYAEWRGWLLPTEAQFQRAAYGTSDGIERRYPWGEAIPSRDHGVFDFASWDPEPAGSRPAGRSAWGVDDLVGNGWEWTNTVFAPFPGFHPMPSYPEYSADFFDGEHVVMKGASPATARELIRPTFRNWFRPRYPYVYATFRCVRP
ncbi:MAG TPA: SUMF1/EgtB/PvdO family nonheme iron enzyme [Vicinamibacterales bacterium]|nr:SUMF1/EgtB/PvdO family nonheme iron enzyme [Vicinamibacterales bacterium]